MKTYPGGNRGRSSQREAGPEQGGGWTVTAVLPRARPGRVSGGRGTRLVMPSGLVLAASGMWTTVFSGRAAIDGTALAGIRLVVGGATMTFLVLGLAAIWRRDFATHRRWMIRGYALPMGAGTQLFTQLPWIVLVGPLSMVSKTVLMVIAWLINLAVAEWIIRRRTIRPAVATTPLAGRAAQLQI